MSSLESLMMPKVLGLGAVQVLLRCSCGDWTFMTPRS
jgi:hypothetical protein